MGYTTIFEGKFELNKTLDGETYKLLKGLANTRRVKRNSKILEEFGFGNAEEFGVDGEFVIEGEWNRMDPSVINYNEPPCTQPGLWLQWIPTTDRKGLIWNGGEKFYKADEWIGYLVESILKPRGYVLEGVVNAQGESEDDQWHIQIENNKIESKLGFHNSVPAPMSYDEWAKVYYSTWRERINVM